MTTINKWVNLEAVNAYADKLDRWSQRELDAHRPDSFSLGSSLANAAWAIKQAAEQAAIATRRATDAGYERLYGVKYAEINPLDNDPGEINEPKCDLCGQPEGEGEADWNGETGNHESCEKRS